MADSDNESGGGGNSGSSGREQDRFLPIANVSRIMKKALPANAKISKEAKETVQECVSEFISFITGEASDKCLREKRKTINGDDLLWAMSTLGFDDYIDPLKLYLHKFRELEGDRQGVGGAAGGGIAGGSATGGGGSVSSSSSQATDVLGGGYGAAGLYNAGGGVAGGGAGMMVMGQQLYGGSPTSGSLYQHQMGSGLFRGGGGGASGGGGGGGGDSSPSGRQGRI